MLYHLVRMSIGLTDGTRVHRWYARAVVTGHSTQEMLATAISEKTTVTQTDVKAVIDALWREIRERLRQGQIVQLGELGHFQLSIRNNGGAVTKESWTKDLIKGARVTYHVTKTMKSITEGVSFTRWVNLEAEPLFVAAAEAAARVCKVETKLDEQRDLLLQLQLSVEASSDPAAYEASMAKRQKKVEQLERELDTLRRKADVAMKVAEHVRAAFDGTLMQLFTEEQANEGFEATEVSANDLNDLPVDIDDEEGFIISTDSSRDYLRTSMHSAAPSSTDDTQSASDAPSSFHADDDADDHIAPSSDAGNEDDEDSDKDNNERNPR